MAQSYSDSSRPVARVKPEADDIYRKSQGSMNTLLNVDDNLKSNYHSARPVARCPSETAQKMLDASKGSMNTFIGGTAEYRPMKVANKHPARGMSSEAASTSEKNKGTATKSLLVNYGALPTSARPPQRLTEQSADIAEGHQGRATKSLFHDYGNLPRSTRPSKNRPEAEAIAHRSMNSSDVNRVFGIQSSRCNSSRSVRSTASGNTSSRDAWTSRPATRIDHFNKRNATTFVTEWS